MKEYHQLIYVSAAVVPMTSEALAELLTRARKHNKRIGVGGALVYHQGSFMQVLEGERAVVDGLLSKIEKDPRHHRLAVVGRSDAARPAFADWSMGFVYGELAQAALPGFTDFLRQGFSSLGVSSTAGRVRDLLEAFRSGRFRQFVNT